MEGPVEEAVGGQVPHLAAGLRIESLRDLGLVRLADARRGQRLKSLAELLLDHRNLRVALLYHADVLGVGARHSCLMQVVLGQWKPIQR